MMRAGGPLLVERCVLAALALAGAGAVWIGAGYGDGTAHGGATVPVLSGGAVAILAAAALLRPGGTPERVAGARPLAALGLTGAFLAGMPWLGFPLAAPLWLAGLMWLLGEGRVTRILAVALALPAAAWLALDRIAFAPPPLGAPLTWALGG
jgi:hypothetical protein